MRTHTLGMMVYFLDRKHPLQVICARFIGSRRIIVDALRCRWRDATVQDAARHQRTGATVVTVVQLNRSEPKLRYVTPVALRVHGSLRTSLVALRSLKDRAPRHSVTVLAYSQRRRWLQKSIDCYLSPGGSFSLPGRTPPANSVTGMTTQVF